MILYNVTCNVEQDIAEEWLNWMLAEHIPEVMQTGCFNDYRVARILNNQEGDTGINYSIQYSAESLERYDFYRNEFAPALQKKTLERYGEKMLAFRTLLEVVK